MLRAIYEKVTSTSVVSPTRTTNGAYLTTNGSLYLVLSEGGRVKVTKLNPFSGTTMTPTYYRSYGSSTKPLTAGSIVLTSTQASYYIGGNLGGTLVMIKASTSGTASIAYTTQLAQPTALDVNSIQIKSLALTEGLLQNT